MTHLGKIKFGFTIIMSIIGASIVGSTFMMRSTPWMDFKYVMSRIQMPIVKMAYASKQDLGMIDMVAATFTKQAPPNSNSAPSAHSIPVLVYHGILPEDDALGVSISRKRWREHMFALKKAGYRTISPKDLKAFINNEHTLPEKSFLLTFDDGRADSFYEADPVLSALNFQAVIFIISKYSLKEDRGYYLAKSQLERMIDSGRWIIGAHAFDAHDESYPIDQNGHQGSYYANRLWLPEQGRLEFLSEYLERVKKELSELKLSLERAFSVEVDSFAFPFGDFGQYRSNEPLAKQLLPETASRYYDLLFYQSRPQNVFTQIYPISDQLNEEAALIRRIDVEGLWSADDLLHVLESGSAKTLPYVDKFVNDNGWINPWGISDVNIKKGLVLTPDSGQTGATAILDGTRLWEDYALTATVDTPAQSSVVIYARFQDTFNNVVCNFGSGFVHIEESIDGTKKVINGIRGNEYSIPKGDFEAGMRVAGRAVQCLVNGSVVVETPYLNPKLDRGGIGFKTWDEHPDTAVLYVRSFSVEQLE